MPARKLKVIDLFSGVGGLSLGAARAGLTVAAAVEIDKHARQSHKRNFPSVRHVDADISTLAAKSLLAEARIDPSEPIGVIGGPPCQGFSTIGHRQANDPRNTLFKKFFELVRDLQPVFFLAENVPGIMRPENDEAREDAFDLVRNDYRLLSPVRASAVDYGVPTTRTRYLFIGYKTSAFSDIKTDLFAGNGVRVTVKDAFHGLPERIRSSWQSEQQGWRRVGCAPSDTHFWKAVRGSIPKGVGDPTAIRMLAKESLVSGSLGTKHTEDVKRRFATVAPGKIDKVSKARRLEWDGYCPTLRAGTGSDRGSYQAVRPIHPSANRVITPREAARLQAFPDWFQFSPTKWHSFRQIGNSVCPILAEHVFRRIIAKRKK